MKGKKIVASLALALGAFSGLVACDKTEDKPEGKDPVTYTVIFKNGDVELSNEEIEQGDFYKIPANPTAPEGKYFVGWDGNNDGNVDELKAATADITYVAVFADKNIEVVEEGSDAKTISFKNEAGDVIGVVLYVPGQENEVVEPQVPVKVGYDGSWANYELNGDNIEVSPVYSLHQYRVSFVADGKQIGIAQYNIENKNINVPAVPAKEGYTGAWEEYVLDSGDKVVNAVYTKNPISVNDILGTYYNGQESLYIGYDSIVLYAYDDIFEKYTPTTYYTEEIYNDPNSEVVAEYYYKIEGDIINLYNYMNQVEKSYQIVGNDVVAITDKLQISTWGTYEYKVDGQVVSQLLINEEGISYIVGDKVYDAAIELENDAISIRLDDEDVQFNLNGNYNYELDLADGAQEFVKVVPQEWYGTYYYANNNPNQVLINDSSLNQLKLVKGGFEYQGTTFIVTESGTLNYLDYSGNIHLEEEYEDGQVVNSWPAEYVKLQEAEVPEELYGIYRSTYDTMIISAEGVTVFGKLAESVVYTYGENSNGDVLEFLNIDGSSYTISSDHSKISSFNSYFKSYPVEDISKLSKEIPAIFDAYKGKLYVDENGNLFQISSDGNVIYAADGYDGSQYYFVDGDAIYIFKSASYALSDQIKIEIVEDKLLLNSKELAQFNIKLSDILGVYLNADSQIVISESGIKYLDVDYAVENIEINVYNIKLSDEITLVYNPDNASLNVNDVAYNYSSTLTAGVPQEWFGEYLNLTINENGVYIGSNSYSIDSIDVKENKMNVSYISYGWPIEYELTYNREDGTFSDDRGNNYPKLLEKVVKEEWVGVWSGSDDYGDYEITITADGMSYSQWGMLYDEWYVIGENKFVVGDYNISYDSAKDVMILDAYGSIVELSKSSSEPGGEDPAPSESLSDELYGTWNAVDPLDSSIAAILVISADSISLEYYGEPYSEYIVSSSTEFSFADLSTYVFVYNETNDTIEMKDAVFGDLVFELTKAER